MMASQSPLLASVAANARTIALMREAATAELARSHAISEKTEASKLRFLAGVSHELRTPLNAIMGFADVILDGHFGPVENPRHEEYLRLIRASANHLHGLMATMLDAVRLEMGRATLNVEPIEVAGLCADCVAVVADPEADARAPVALTIAGQGDPRLRQDPARLRQILINLLRNAVEHTPDGESVILSVDPGAVGEDGFVASIRFAVSDHGPGISLANQQELFKPFSQIEDPMTSGEGGLGLGLSICRSLAELMGGSIGCTSEPGKETTFWVDLPDRRDE